MDKRLENYLQKVETELGALEAEQRASELREMRHHIEAIVARLVEGGLSESEATEAAIAQFGAARKVGRELQTAGVQNESPVRAAAAVLGVFVVYVWLGDSSMPLIQAAQDALGMAAWIIPVLMGALASFATGVFAGFIAPKRGGRAALWTFGTSGLLLVALAFVALRAVKPVGYSELLVNLVALLAQMVVMWFGADFGARHAQNRDLTKV